MDAVTYPNPEVQSFLQKSVVFFKPQIEKEAELAGRFAVTWTPGLLWLDGRGPDRQGTVHHQNVGWFEPQEFLAEQRLGCAKVLTGEGEWERALEQLDSLVSELPETYAAPAALYWAGVAAKKASDEVEGLLERWNRLLDTYPDSAWAMKVSFLRKG